jgi:hypothetical protein
MVRFGWLLLYVGFARHASNSQEVWSFVNDHWQAGGILNRAKGQSPLPLPRVANVLSPTARLLT